MKNTKIEWCDHTFNPVIGCAKISPGCENCYAETLSKRTFKVAWGAGETRKRTSDSYWSQPLRWEAQAALLVSVWDRAKDQFRATDEELIAKGFIKPTPPRVFCASLSDVFDNEWPIEWRADLFQLIAGTPHLNWMVLTKRIGNVMKMLQEVAEMPRSGSHEGHLLAHQWRKGNPPPNVHLGATVCDQSEADRDVPKLLAWPAAKRFLSIEPMLGPIDLTAIDDKLFDGKLDALSGLYRWNTGQRTNEPRRIDLVIDGGESGPQARPSHPDWFRSLRDQCARAGVPYMHKQNGEWAPSESCANLPVRTIRGASWFASKWLFESVTPKRSEEMHRDDSPDLYRVGKKNAGRLLDGVEHNGVIA